MENMTKKDLLQVCANKGITSVNSKSLKEDIIAALKKHQEEIKKSDPFSDEY